MFGGASKHLMASLYERFVNSFRIIGVTLGLAGCSISPQDLEPLAIARADYIQSFLPIEIGTVWVWRAYAEGDTVVLRTRISKMHEISSAHSMWQRIQSHYCQLRATHFYLELGLKYQVILADEMGYPLLMGKVDKELCLLTEEIRQTNPNPGYIL